MKKFLQKTWEKNVRFHHLLNIFFNTLPILLMIFLVPLVTNDYFLTLFYILIILGSLSVTHTKMDFVNFFSGFILMIIFEYIFISTGVETFVRRSLFGVMPLWLPFLWGYGFIAIARSVKIIDRIYFTI